MRHGLGKGLGIALLALGFSVAGLAPIPAAAGDTGDETIQQIIGVLRENGLIDPEEEERLLMKHAAERQKNTPDVASALLEGWDFYGDLRLRYERFDFDKDKAGNEQDNRNRFRYRARIGFEKQVNNWLLGGMRLASGTNDNRSTNQTIGDDEDFDPDDLFIDRAYLEFALPKYAGVESHLVAGKIANPFVWKAGKDFVVWDGDINPEGAALTSSYALSESASLFGTVGGFIADENSSDSDPKFTALQLGGVFGVADGLELGLRATSYQWHSLDTAFVTRAGTWGNLTSAYDGKANIGELASYVRLDRGGNWPVLLYGTFVENFTADSAVIDSLHAMSPGPIAVDEENQAWGVGLELGSSKKIVKLGLGYFHVEANAVVASFTDSDLFDGFTNREGFVAYGSRKIGKNSEFKLTLFSSDDIEDTGGAFGPFVKSLANADRFRLQSDFEVKF